MSDSGSDSEVGTIFDVQRFSVHDGPGIRTTVFLKGCPLRCVWCQNPEGLDRALRVWCFDNLCVGCGDCAAVCPASAIRPRDDGKPVVDMTACLRCGRCVDECCRNALALDGRETTAGELVRELLADRVFFDASGGGVTFSGGEPLAQAEFVRAVAERLKAEGVATAIETSLDAPWEAVESLIPVIDYFQADVKLTDAARHLAATGRDNAAVLENFRRLAAALDNPAERLRARLPLVPGFTDDEENIRRVAAFVAGVNPEIPLELLNFNPLAESKYRRMPDRDYRLMGANAFSEEEMERFRAIAGEQAIII